MAVPRPEMAEGLLADPGLAVVATGHVAVARPEMADGLRDGRGALAAAAGQVAAVRPETACQGVCGNLWEFHAEAIRSLHSLKMSLIHV